MRKHEIAAAQCAARLDLSDRGAVIGEVAGRIAAHIGVDTSKVQSYLEKREAVGSTGLEHGIALPHCALPDVQEFTIGVITTSRPLDFGALDGKPSDIFVFVAGPEGRRTEHVRILAAMTAQLREESVRRRLREAQTGDDLAAILQGGLVPDEHEEVGAVSMLLLYVQDEDLYEPILEAVSGEADASVAVSQAQSAGAILHRMPLFATFWNDQETREIHRIEVILPRDRVNRTIRRVEELVGGKSGVQISALDLSYGSGALDL